MSPSLTRRELLAAGAALPFAGGLGSLIEEDASFSFTVLGDVHYDRLDHHDFEWLKREKPNDIRQVENYSRITREILPDFLASVNALASKNKSEFILQLGDFVEGLCGTPELAKKHLVDFVAFLGENKVSLPFWVTKGNHDVTGPGSVEAYNEVIWPWQKSQTKVEAVGANQSVAKENARFFLFDAYDREALDWFEAAVEKRTEDHCFFVIHPPVVPYGARSTWHIFARENQKAQRERLLTLLGRHNAIVLCGHLHKYGTVVRSTPQGRFIQVDLLSVLPRKNPEIRDELKGVHHYGPDLIRLEPNFSPDTKAERQAALKAESPFIQHYHYADFAGLAQVSVSKKSVVAQLFNGLDQNPWHRLNLTQLRDA